MQTTIQMQYEYTYKYNDKIQIMNTNYNTYSSLQYNTNKI